MEVTRDDGLFISDDPALVDHDKVFRWIAEESWWGLGRPRGIVERSLEGSHVYGVYADRETMVGLTRVITDYATFAYFCDVYVAEDYRGKGVGPWLSREIVADLKALGINRFLLATKDKHSTYEKAGFYPVARPQVWMEIDERPTKPGPVD
ncbi:MAG: GNAT family N-acetyltransferase [Catenulispora sp.]|nr:GNAT family N-acetyltransferase [Catenulispora sp.]